MHIAIVGINYAPEEIGIGRYTTDLARNLAERGHAVSVVAGKPYYPRWKIFEGYDEGGWLSAVEQGVAITRCPHYVPQNPSGLRRILHLASFSLSALVPAIVGLDRQTTAQAPGSCSVHRPFAAQRSGGLALRQAGGALWIHVQISRWRAALPPACWLKAMRWPSLRLASKRLCCAWLMYRPSISPQMCKKLEDKGFA
jgi:colanic acid biosynthesis glycosyl transferase WcaI